MQKFNLQYPTNCFQRLFIEKAVESLYENTIDSYRLRLHNPKTLIQELISVTQSSLEGILTNNDYVESTAQELIKILDDFHELNFNRINQAHFESILKKPNRSDYKKIIQSSKLLLRDNQYYFSALFQKITQLIASHNIFLNDLGQIEDNKGYEKQKKHIIILVDFLLIELIRKDFTKQYLHKIFQSIFVYNRTLTGFDERLSTFQSICQKVDEPFQVIFLITDNTFKFEELEKIDSTYFFIDRKFRAINKKYLSVEVNNFLDKHKEDILIGKNINSKDYYKAIQIGVNQLSKDLDIYHFGYHKKHYKIGNQCAVIGSSKDKASVNPSNFQIDGYFKSDSEIFDKLLQKINLISNKDKVEIESKKKIMSAIRYYRTGSESPELETKFLNYWIGLEFIYTSFDAENKTIERIRTNLPNCHGLIYVKRNLYDFHKTLERLGVSNYINGYNSNLLYLSEHDTYNTIINNTDSELLKFRAKFYQKWREDPSRIADVLKKHNSNLTWNLTRLYRIRNEIVHNAAIKEGIYTHIAHLKYYLSFTLNSILSYMAGFNPDVDNDGFISIEDFFISQEIISGCLKNQTLTKYLEVENPHEIFQ